MLSVTNLSFIRPDRHAAASPQTIIMSMDAAANTSEPTLMGTLKGVLDSSPAILRILFAERGAPKSAPRTGGEMAHSGAELAKNGTQQARMRFNAGEGQSGTKAR